MSRIIQHFIPNADQVTSRQMRIAYGKFSSWIGILSNLLLFFIKGIAGILSSSLSITADAVNNLSDASSSIISLFGFKLSMRPADKEHPFGHGRYEYLAGLMVAVLILTIGLELLKSSIGKIIHPKATTFNLLIFSILCFSILLKLWQMHFYKKTGLLIHSQTLIATAADSRNDVISTAAVLAAALISHFSGYLLDGYMSFAVALFILYSGFGLVRETLDPLLGSAPDPELVEQIRKRILSYDKVLDAHDLMIHDYGPGRQFGSVHVEMPAEENVLVCHEIIDKMEQDFLSEFNLHMIIHYDPVVTSGTELTDFRMWLTARLKELHPSLRLHDLRLINCSTYTNVFFDCVMPEDIPLTQEEITGYIRTALAENYPDYVCVITFDTSFAPIQT